jgi:hypothetical protein
VDDPRFVRFIKGADYGAKIYRGRIYVAGRRESAKGELAIIIFDEIDGGDGVNGPSVV